MQGRNYLAKGKNLIRITGTASICYFPVFPSSEIPLPACAVLPALLAS